jgi:opacity protein-like surface antigen
MNLSRGGVMSARFLTLVACAALSLAAQAASAQSLWYATGSVGGFFREDAGPSATTFSNSLGETAPGTNTTTFVPGPIVNLGLGYRLPLRFRIEGELGYGYYTTDTTSPLATNGTFPALNGSRLSGAYGGAHNQESATLNAFYDLPMAWFAPYVSEPDRFAPYAGGGVGYYHSEPSSARFVTVTGAPFTISGRTSNNAMLLAEGGLSVHLNGGWSIVPAYRFEHLFVSGSSSVNANIFKIGFRYSF